MNDVHWDHDNDIEELFFTVRDSSGQVAYLSGEVFETWATDGRNADDYDTVLTNVGGKRYTGHFPSWIPAGVYSIQAWAILIGNPTDDDELLGSLYPFKWNGNAEVITVDSIATVLADLINGGRLDLLIDAIKAKTDNLPSDPADASEVSAQIAAAHTATDILIEALNDLSFAEVQTAVSGLATTANLQVVDDIVDYLKKLAECDSMIDVSGTPYVLIKLEKGTSNEILRKQLKDLDGTGIAASGVVVGQHIHMDSP